VMKINHLWWSKEISNSDLIPLLTSLLENSNYSFNIPWESATLEIKQV
jgi:hypothetical protein